MIHSINAPDPSTPITAKARRELADIKAHFISLAIRLKDTNQIPIDWLEVYPETSNLNEIYQQLSDLKKCLD